MAVFPVLCKAKSFAAYLRSIGSLALDVLDGTTFSKIGHTNLALASGTLFLE